MKGLYVDVRDVSFKVCFAAGGDGSRAENGACLRSSCGHRTAVGCCRSPLWWNARKLRIARRSDERAECGRTSLFAVRSCACAAEAT